MSANTAPSRSVGTSRDGSLPLDPPQGVRVIDLQPRNPSEDSRLTMYNQYLRGPQIGFGQHGSVYQCWDTKSGTEVAIKVVKRNNPRAEKMFMLRQQNQRQPTSGQVQLKDRLGPAEYKIRKEIAIMKKCRHAHIVELLEVIDDKENEKILMVMEFLGGGEIKWRTKAGEPTLQVNQSRRICRDVILGLEYLHYQGIIHRDIKPANLLWTVDRRAVKIADFGVSHFSYAQRLAAAGQSRAQQDNPNDPILLDDSDLSKTAGTPTFLAPEVISEPTIVPSPPASSHSSSTVQICTPKRPPITKAIDIWSLGVTLYCLLFGRIPFQAPEDENPSPIHSEYMLYETIRSQDWKPDETMGFDHVPTGGRHPQEQDTEGAVVMNLLDQMLQKDASKRILLDDLKRHPWFLRDISEPKKWIHETSPMNQEMVMVTDTETSTAMSPLRFSWGWNKDRIKSLLRTVRPRRSFRSSRRGDDDRDDVGVMSAPHVSINRHKGGRKTSSKSKMEKGKGLGAESDNLKSAPVTPGRSKSFERWPASRPHPSGSSVTLAGSAPKARRGSETLLVPRALHWASQQSSPTSSRDTDDSALVGKHHPPHFDERSRNRFSFLKPSSWRSNKSTQALPHTESATSTCSSPGIRHSPTSSNTHGASTPNTMTRRSEEGLHRRGILSRRSNSSGRLTAARRASSWGDPMDYTADATSLHGGERVDDETMNLGAGGIYHDFLPSTPSVPQSLASVAEVSGSIPLTIRHPQPEHYIYSGSSTPYTPDPAAHDALRHGQARLSTTSPLAQEIYAPPVHSGGDEAYDDDDDDASSFGNPHTSRLHPEQSGGPPTRTSVLYAEEDEEDDDDDEGDLVRPLVFRRKPSVSVTVASPSPPPDSDEE